MKPTHLHSGDYLSFTKRSARQSHPRFVAICLLLCLSIVEAGRSQGLDPVPPTTGLPTELRMSLMKKRLKQPPPPSAGFWVVTEQSGRKGPTLLSYYTEQQQLVKTDTIPHKRIDIRRRTVVKRLNERLEYLLATYPASILATRR